MTTPFALAVRAALDEIDTTPGRDHWQVRDSDKLTQSILTYLIAYGLARAEAEDTARWREDPTTEYGRDWVTERPQ